MTPILRVFTARHGEENRIEDKFAAFMQENPEYTPTRVQTCTNQNYVVVTILFEKAQVLWPNFIPQTADPVPLGGRQEITCDGKDPWNGEFIPVGDPPNSRPVIPISYGRRPTPVDMFDGRPVASRPLETM